MTCRGKKQAFEPRFGPHLAETLDGRAPAWQNPTVVAPRATGLVETKTSHLGASVCRSGKPARRRLAAPGRRAADPRTPFPHGDSARVPHDESACVPQDESARVPQDESARVPHD
jgi:hypothetical protein